MTAANPLAPRRTAPPPDRTGLLVLQGLAVLAALVLAAPTVRQRREEQPDA